MVWYCVGICFFCFFFFNCEVNWRLSFLRQNFLLKYFFLMGDTLIGHTKFSWGASVLVKCYTSLSSTNGNVSAKSCMQSSKYEASGLGMSATLIKGKGTSKKKKTAQYQTMFIIQLTKHLPSFRDQFSIEHRIKPLRPSGFQSWLPPFLECSKLQLLIYKQNASNLYY